MATTDNAFAPFRDVISFDREAPEEETPRAEPPRAPSWSPFVSVYETVEGESNGDEPAREEYAALVNELYDEEFDEALYELINEARSLHETHLDSGRSVADADRIVTQHFYELTREAEAMVDSIAREVTTRQTPFLDEELDQFVERYAPSTHLTPAFEDWLGKLGKKLLKGAGKIVSKAAQVAKAVALGPVFAQIKRILQPLLKQVLLKAIGKLPVAIQPAARTLAQRLGFALPAPAPPLDSSPAAPLDAGPLPGAGSSAPAAEPAVSAVASGPVSAPSAAAPDVGAAVAPDAASPGEASGSSVQPDAGDDVSEMQLEFDERLAEAMLAPEEPELDLEIARARSGYGVAETPVFRDLDQARERFVNDLENLREGENPEPYVENFLPAVLPALRVGIKVAGRTRVVNLLASLLGRLLSKLVGPSQAPALSRAIVDTGLKLLSLEAAPDNEARLASSALAATVEETVSRVASLPEYVFEDETLFEGYALDAFERAAAANLPAVFPESLYRRRPELLEGGVNAAWVLFPLRRPRYKRCSHPFKVRITPHMAEEIESFEDSRLSDYFQDQLGLPEGDDVEAELHLFETIAGGNASDIARQESEVIGVGAGDAVAVSQFQPLTPQAAEVLLGRPGLGRALPPGTNIRTVPAGQRLYVIAGRRPLTVPGYAGLRRVRRMAHLKVTLDCPGDQIRVCVFFSEVKAQRLAVRLRQQAHAGSVTVAFHRLVGRRLPPILHGKRRRRLRIVHSALAPGAASVAVLQQLPAIVPQVFVAKVQEWMVRAFADFIKTGADKFLAAAQDPSDGVTLKFIVEHPPGLKELCGSLVAKGPAATALADIMTKAVPPTVRVEALPGHKCE